MHGPPLPLKDFMFEHFDSDYGVFGTLISVQFIGWLAKVEEFLQTKKEKKYASQQLYSHGISLSAIKRWYQM